jgi:hypothetical protein
MPPTPSPTYERLRDYIARRMRMSHVYQPLMLMELLGRRSPAPAQDVARRILGEDVTQIDYYTERVKRMVGKVHLQRHHPLRPGRLRLGGRRGAERRRYLAEGQRGGATTRPAAAAVPPAPRWLPNAAWRGGFRPQEPPPHPDQRLDQSPGAHPGQGPLRMLRRRLLLGKPCT